MTAFEASKASPCPSRHHSRRGGGGHEREAAAAEHVGAGVRGGKGPAGPRLHLHPCRARAWICHLHLQPRPSSPAQRRRRPGGGGGMDAWGDPLLVCRRAWSATPPATTPRAHVIRDDYSRSPPATPPVAAPPRPNAGALRLMVCGST
ncbi:unnamed protein product [Urochloa humidicola]